ncbi:MAG: COQ9 family protein [Pseudomonadota bacterium]
MSDTAKIDEDPVADVKARVLSAALPIVPFDGWSDRTLAEAVRDAEVDPALSRLAFPRGGVDLALAFHAQSDATLRSYLETTDLSALRYSERVAQAISQRLDIVAPHREAVRRAASLFALPIWAPDGARAVWQTSDTIWKGLGDTSRDVNYYTKRATLSTVYSSVVLYWLGDDSEGQVATRAFIDRRIENVMQFEKLKSSVKNTSIGRALEAGAERLFDRVRAPEPGPGRWED